MKTKYIQIGIMTLLVILACALSFLYGIQFVQATLHATTVRLPDSTEITCITSNAGGVTCSWSTESVAPKNPELSK